VSIVNSMVDAQKVLNASESCRQNIPPGISLKHDPWWKQLWRRLTGRYPRQVRIRMKEHLGPYSDEAYYRIVGNGWFLECVRSHAGPLPVECACGGTFEDTGEREGMTYRMHHAELWQCAKCQGRISVRRIEAAERWTLRTKEMIWYRGNLSREPACSTAASQS